MRAFIAMILSYACVYVLFGGGLERNTDFNLSTNDILLYSYYCEVLYANYYIKNQSFIKCHYIQ